MKKIIITLLGVALASFACIAQNIDIKRLPAVIQAGPEGSHHVQGICVDNEAQYIYVSFTNFLVKMDLQGNVIGRTGNLYGHLGCLEFNPEDGKVYGSLEYKDDVIGRGIADPSAVADNYFYVAILDVDKIQGDNVDPAQVMKVVNLPQVRRDYLDTVVVDGKKLPHAFACSGIDGMSFGPKFGKTGGKQYLTVAYGIYGDVNRTDNDYQVLSQYDISSWDKWAEPLDIKNPNTKGPEKSAGRYYVFTGNTNWGVQNLEYDPYTDCWLMAVYKGKKPQYPNYNLYVIDNSKKPVRGTLKGVPYETKPQMLLSLSDNGEHQGDIYGWRFPYGSTGIHAFGNGWYYISENYKDPDGKGQASHITLYKLYGRDNTPFCK